MSFLHFKVHKRDVLLRKRFTTGELLLFTCTCILQYYLIFGMLLMWAYTIKGQIKWAHL